MKTPYLEVTFRKGQPLAAYFYLSRCPGDVSHRTERAEDGLLIDFADDDRPIGIEITAPRTTSVAAINRILKRLGQSLIEPQDIEPLHAA